MKFNIGSKVQSKNRTWKGKVVGHGFIERGGITVPMYFVELNVQYRDYLGGNCAKPFISTLVCHEDSIEVAETPNSMWWMDKVQA